MKHPYRTALSMAVALSLVVSAEARADDQGTVVADASAPTPAKGPTLSDILNNSNITVKGYLDASYIYHSQTPNSSVQVFDTAKNSFGLHQAGFTIASTPAQGFGGLLNLTAGSDAGIFCSYGECSSGTGTTAGGGGNFDVTQAYAQYAAGSWTTIGGKFTTLAGAEVIDSSADTNVTRSILFGKIPFTHTGVRATDALTDSTSVIVGVNNGWDQVTGMTASKTVELGLTSAFTKDTSLAVSIYDGAETMPSFAYGATIPSAGLLTPTAGAPFSGNRELLDAVFTTNLTSSLTFILNGDYVRQQDAYIPGGDAKYWGLAGYLNYQINDQYRVSFRAEDLRDETGLATALAGTPMGADNVREATLTLGYAPVKNFELRGELREDRADQGIFLGTNGSSLAQSMTTVAVQGVYKF